MALHLEFIACTSQFGPRHDGNRTGAGVDHQCLRQCYAIIAEAAAIMVLTTMPRCRMLWYTSSLARPAGAETTSPSGLCADVPPFLSDLNRSSSDINELSIPLRGSRYVKQCLLMADIVAKGVLASERATLIQDQAPMRNVDSKIHSSGFVCGAFLLSDRPVATFATKSALS
jgi:hypothetical protein